jgi:hypothetical protein
MDIDKRLRMIRWIAVLFAISGIICTVIVSGAVVRTHSEDDVIRVTGSSQQPIRSDYIIWDSTVTEQAPTMAATYSALQASSGKVQAYLVQQGVLPSEIIPSSITTTTLYAPVKDDSSSSDNSGSDSSSDSNSATYRAISGYQLSQTFEVRSSRVDLIDGISRKSTALISEGVPFESQAPEYLYTKLSDLKVTMLAQAAKDARNRAEQIADSAGCRLGEVRFARMGVLQIEPLYTSAASDNDISDTGANDTSALDKKITAVVTAGYAIK